MVRETPQGTIHKTVCEVACPNIRTRCSNIRTCQDGYLLGIPLIVVMSKDKLNAERLNSVPILNFHRDFKTNRIKELLEKRTPFKSAFFKRLDKYWNRHMVRH